MRRLCLLLLLISLPSRVWSGEKVKTLSDILGSSNLYASGIGVVTGLRGTGDKATGAVRAIHQYFKENEFAADIRDLSSKNFALVQVDVVVPPFARPGAMVDVRVSAIGDASSLEGGTLLPTPVFFQPKSPPIARASGQVQIGYVNNRETNQPTRGRIPANLEGGAQILESLPFDFINADNVFCLALKKSSFANATAIARAINNDPSTNPNLRSREGFGNQRDMNEAIVAEAIDAGLVEVHIPPGKWREKTAYVQAVLDLPVQVERLAQVRVNLQSNTIIITGEVRVEPVVVSHRNLTINLAEQLPPAQPALVYPIQVNDRRVIETEGYGSVPNLRTLVDTLNAMNVNTNDVIDIVLKLHKAGALHAELVLE